MKRDGDVFVSMHSIRYAARRSDLEFHLDGRQVRRTIVETPNKQWKHGVLAWSGKLKKGSHKLYLKGNKNHQWGCGPAWSHIDMMTHAPIIVT